MKKPVRQPLYVQAAESMRDFIAQSALRPGDALPAESVMAAQLGVSVMTVREALSALAQGGVVERVHGKGTFVKVIPRQHVAVLCELNLSVSPHLSFFTRLINQLPDALHRCGHESRLYMGHTLHGTPPPAGPTCPAFYEDLEAGLISAVASATSYPDPRWLKPLHERDVPVVEIKTDSSAGLYIDYEAMIRNGLDYLDAKGCRRILFFCYGPPGRDSSWIDCFRAEAEHRGMSSAGAYACDQALASRHLPTAADLFRRHWAEPAARPDGLLVLDDLLFNDIAIAMLSLNVRTGEDLQVVTHSNKGCNTFGQLPVGRLEVDVYQCALEMAALLTKKMRGEAVYYPVVMNARVCPAPGSMPVPPKY